MMPEATSAAPRMSVSHTAVKQRIVERHQPCDDVEDAESEPEQEPPPGPDLERVMTSKTPASNIMMPTT